MADPKRKSRGGASRNGSTKKQKTGSSFRSDDKPLKRRGPRLPNQFRKVLDGMNPRKRSGGDSSDSDAEERIDFEEAAMNAAYEYEEEVPEEESGKNRRFDPVETLEYETPDEFEVFFFFLICSIVCLCSRCVVKIELIWFLCCSSLGWEYLVRRWKRRWRWEWRWRRWREWRREACEDVEWAYGNSQRGV